MKVERHDPSQCPVRTVAALWGDCGCLVRRAIHSDLWLLEPRWLI